MLGYVSSQEGMGLHFTIFPVQLVTIPQSISEIRARAFR